MKMVFRFALQFTMGICLCWAAMADTGTLPKIKSGDPLPADLFVKLAKMINPAVVNIYTTFLPRGMPNRMGRDPFFDLFEEFMGPNPYGRGGPQQSLGTGFIIRKDGLIVTNNHVVDKADVIKVQLDESSKEGFDAKLIGKDPRTDIALIKITSKKDLPYVALGSSSETQVGEWVAAFGNPYGYGHTVTKGIISAVGREIDELNLLPFMQTDASINPGNSGGPLVNTQGQVIGVNTAIDARAQGIGFVIPIDNVKQIIPQLEKDGTIERGFIGVGMADIDDQGASSLNLKHSDGALITQVFPGTPAEKSGLKNYDLIVEFNGKKIENTGDLSRAVSLTPIGTRVTVKVVRNGAPKTLSLTVGKSPDMKAARSRGRPGPDSRGVLAPFDMGFVIADYSVELAREFDLPKLKNPHPVVTAVDPSSVAASSGIAPGDILLDINRREVGTAKQAIQQIKRNSLNVFRILKSDRVVLISIRT